MGFSFYYLSNFIYSLNKIPKKCVDTIAFDKEFVNMPRYAYSFGCLRLVKENSRRFKNNKLIGMEKYAKCVA